MKIHVTREDADAITGYTKVPVTNETINFGSISDNECEFIMANQILDEFTSEKIAECLKSLISKLRIDGTVVVGGTDLRMFCVNTINGSIHPQESSVAIGRCKSMSDASDVSSFLVGLGLTVLSTRVSGNHYEVTAKR